MRTIAIMNLKGGVGKTVTTINMAAVLAKSGRGVLVMDADSQCNCTEFFGADTEALGMGDLLTSVTANFTAFIQPSNHIGIVCVSASPALMDLDLSKVEEKRVSATAIAGFICDMEASAAASGIDSIDYILIDCPPAFNAATVAALAAADEVIIPMKLDAFSLRGMGNLLRQVSNMRKINPRLKVAGVLITMWRKDPALAEAEAQLRKISALPVFRTHIRHSATVDAMTLAQEPLQVYSPHSGAGLDYKRFVAEYLEGGAGNE